MLFQVVGVLYPDAVDGNNSELVLFVFGRDYAFPDVVVVVNVVTVADLRAGFGRLRGYSVRGRGGVGGREVSVRGRGLDGLEEVEGNSGGAGREYRY